MTNYILSHYQEGVTTLTLNRPKQHNAFHPALISELTAALTAIRQDACTRVLLLTGAGSNFSAGADLRWMQQSSSSTQEENFASAWQLSELMESLYRLNKPTIALAQGKVIGGAIGLLACCDIAIASEDADFCFSEVKLGLVPAIISPYVIATIGTRAAQRYFITAEKFSAQTAQAIGLIHEVVPAKKLLAKGQLLAQQILANGPEALEATKLLLKNIENRYASINYELRTITADLIAQIRVSAEAQNGLNAFFSKQAPPWQKTTK